MTYRQISCRRTITLLLCSFFPGWTAGEWPQFRGPNASGVGIGADLPAEFGTDGNLLWKAAMPAGKSSPVLTADSVFLTAHDGKKLLTLCLDRETGKLRWRQELMPNRSEHRHPVNDPAAPSPVVDGTNVYVFFGDYGLLSYAPDGRERWRLPLGPFKNISGMAASPVLSGRTLVLLCDHDENSFLLAVDKDSGKVLWKTPRPSAFSGYSTPVIFRPDNGPDQVLVLGSFQLAAYAVDTGEKLWWVDGFSVQSKAVPVIDDGVVYCAMRGTEAEGPGQFSPFAAALEKSDADGDGFLARLETDGYLLTQFGQVDRNKDGYLNEEEYSRFADVWKAETVVMAIHPRGRGNLTQSSILWRYHKGVPHVPSPLLYQGVLYLVRDGGIVTSLDPATGKALKQARVQEALGDYFASPVAADGKIYLLSAEGKLAVLKAGPDWEVIAVNDLEEEAFATPAIGQRELYVRTGSALYCFGTRADKHSSGR